MNILITLLCGFLWFTYGVFAAKRTKDVQEFKDDPIGSTAVFIMCAPAILVCRALYGIFKEYK